MTDIITKRAVEAMKYGKAITPFDETKINVPIKEKKSKYSTAQMIELLHKGKNYSEIARKLKCSQATVANRLRGLKPERTWTAEAIIERMKQGDTYEQCAENVGCSIHTVKNVIRKSEIYKFIKERRIYKKIDRLIAQGMNHLDIIKELNIPYSTMERYSGNRWK